MDKRITRGLVAASLTAGAVAANAAVPAGTEAVFTGLATDFGTILGYGYTLMGVVVAGLIVLGLVKKVAKKSSS
ncbi:MAG: hypothetical protein JSR38_14950 [Proteobacteria bacterium]|nr:hypothetical protein [Pseudomonadota bacterium]MBS2023492.1 hypothetical protein [Deltaproteobacteria bacterium]